MQRRLPVLAFILYVTLDLSNPFILGAFRFNPDECVESIQLERERDGWAATRDADRVAKHEERQDSLRATARRHVPHALTDWLVSVRRAHVPASPPSAPSEDH